MLNGIYLVWIEEEPLMKMVERVFEAETLRDVKRSLERVNNDDDVL